VELFKSSKNSINTRKKEVLKVLKYKQSILFIGGAGYIGSHVVLALKMACYDIVTFYCWN
jgi:hypothetical protein